MEKTIIGNTDQAYEINRYTTTFLGQERTIIDYMIDGIRIRKTYDVNMNIIDIERLN